MRLKTIDAALTQFTTSADAKARCSSPREDARLYRRMSEAVVFLFGQGVQGRTAFDELLSSPSPHVRCWAAAQLLYLGDSRANRILEDLRDAGGPASFDAEWTLREHSEGTLGSPFAID